MWWLIAAYVIGNFVIWLVLFDEYDTIVLGWQQTNFSFHERLRLALLLPGLPLLLSLSLALNIRDWREVKRLISNFWSATKDHWAIITTGSKLGYVAKNENSIS